MYSGLVSISSFFTSINSSLKLIQLKVSYAILNKHFGGTMKNSLNIVLVLILTFVGAEALASALDAKIHKVVSETNDHGSEQNSNTGEGAGGGSRPTK